MNNKQYVVTVTLIGVFTFFLLFGTFKNTCIYEGNHKVMTYNHEPIHEDDKLFIPEDKILSTYSQNNLTWLYWRYVNTIQIVCSNQMRHGNVMGKEVCIDKAYIPEKPCLVYSFGSQLNFEFELAILRAYECEVHVFDPSTNKKRTEEVTPRGVHFHFIGLDGHDYVDNRGWTMRSLPSIVENLHHKNRVIDILKVDAEGAEWRGFQDMDNYKPLENVKQLLVEFHFGIHKKNELWGQTTRVNQIRVLRRLYEYGFRIFMREHVTAPVRYLDSVYGNKPLQQNELCLININYLKEYI